MIEVNNLVYRYPKSSQATLHGLDFSIERGEIFGFLGPSGAGKSTTQKILFGLLEGFQGEVNVMGRAISSWGNDYYESVGVSFEQPNHFLKLTGLENLRYFSALFSGKTRKPEDLLELVGLSEDADTLVAQYSKGMKNRLTLVRALLNDPDLLFLDEPTSGLDPLNAHNVKEIIKEQKRQGKTIFLTTHNMTVADELCDRVAFLVDGQIRLADSPYNLKLSHGVHSVQVEYRNGAGLEKKEFRLENIGDNDEFIKLLRSARVETIHTQEATLEKIFLQITGRSLT